MRNVSASTLVYGPTGTGKTTLLATLAEWVWITYGKITRMVTTEPGGYADQVAALVDVGIMEVYRAHTRDPNGSLGLPTGTLHLLTQGYWPVTINEDRGGPVGVALEPPEYTKWELYCPNGHLTKTGVQQRLLVPGPCPVCNFLTNQQNGKVIKVLTPNPKQALVGATVFDSLQSMCAWAMQDVSARAGRNELGGMKGAINTIISDGQVFGAAGMAGIGFIQERVPVWSTNATTIPGLVVPPVFTAGELRVSSESEVAVYGPALIGQAKTETAPSWFGNCLNTAIVLGEDGRKRWRLYLQEWYRPGDQAKHHAKVRCSPGLLPEYFEDQPGAEPFSGFNLGRLFAELKRVEERAGEWANKLRAARPEGAVATPVLPALPPTDGAPGAAPGEGAAAPTLPGPGPRVGGVGLARPSGRPPMVARTQVAVKK